MEPKRSTLNTTLPCGRGLGEGDNLDGFKSSFANLIGELTKTVYFWYGSDATTQALVILGKPNVGKSTLINAILGEDRMLVHHEPGTTRDYVSEFISVDGIPFELVDTAGVRKTRDMLEVMSIEMTQEQLRAPIWLSQYLITHENLIRKMRGILSALNSWLTTNSSGDLQKKANAHALIPVVNKCDLPAKLDKQRIEANFQQPVCSISALNKAGFEDLNRRLVQELDTAYKPMNLVVFNKRQYLLLAKADSLVKQEKDCLASKCF